MNWFSHKLHEQNWNTIGIRLLLGLCLLTAVVWFGRNAGHEIKAMESWIEGHGLWGRIAFVGMAIVFTLVFLPNSLLEIATGVMIPPMFVGVYFGYVTSHITKVAGHVSDHSMLHTVVTAVGFVVCVLLMIVVTRVTTKALAEAESELAE